MEELLLEKLREAGKEQAKMMMLLKVREDEIESLHQLLWHSEVAPNQGELSKLLRRRSSCQDDELEVAQTLKKSPLYTHFIQEM